MIRLAVVLFALAVVGYYLFEIEGSTVSNSLLCQYSATDVNEIYRIYLKKIRKLLPDFYPEQHFTSLTTDISFTPDEHKTQFCSPERFSAHQNSVFFDARIALYPLYPETTKTLKFIYNSQINTRVAIEKMNRLKKAVEDEAIHFENFLRDCSRIKTFVEQIELLKSHLKIEKASRNPSHLSKQSSLEFHMNKSISRQLGFAKRQLIENEKLFHYKWKKYLQQNTGKNLCRY